MSALPAPPPEVEAPPSEVTDAEALEEVQLGEDTDAGEPQPSPEEIQAAIDALGPEDEAVKALQEAAPQPSVDEERITWETERELREIGDQVNYSMRQAVQYDPTGPAFRERAGTLAAELAYPIANTVQQFTRDLLAGKEDNFDPDQHWVMNPDWLTQKITEAAAQLVQEALPASSGYFSSRTEQTVLADLAAKPVHKLLTAEDRAAIKQARQTIRPINERLTKIIDVYLHRAVQGAPEIRERMTKADREREKEHEKHREVLARAVGRGTPASNGAGTLSLSRQKEDELLADPNTPMHIVNQIEARRAKAR